MTEKETLISIFKLLEKLEIKGSENVLVLYNTMAFIQSKISEIDKQSKTEKGG